MKISHLELDPISLGFTFSFPMTQKGLDVGILVAWTKSFNCPGVIGQVTAIFRRLPNEIRLIFKIKIKFTGCCKNAQRCDPTSWKSPSESGMIKVIFIKTCFFT